MSNPTNTKHDHKRRGGRNRVAGYTGLAGVGIALLLFGIVKSGAADAPVVANDTIAATITAPTPSPSTPPQANEGVAPPVNESDADAQSSPGDSTDQTDGSTDQTDGSNDQNDDGTDDESTPDDETNDESGENNNDSRSDQEAAPPLDVVQADVGHLSSLCAATVHSPVPDQESLSGIWINGEVYGLESGAIWVEGESLNGGAPVEIPIIDGAFDGGLGIDRFGDHGLSVFEARTGSGTFDLLGDLDAGPGRVFSVDETEGPNFDQPCFVFDQPGAALGPESGLSSEPTVEVATAFVADFVADHLADDTDALLNTLHPGIRMAFDDDVCRRYVEQTVGSVVGATVLDADPVAPFELDTPDGPIGFPEAIPVIVEFTFFDGATRVDDIHLPLHDGEVFWLTTCGTTAP